MAGLGAQYVLIGDDFQFGARRLGNFSTLQACPHFVTEAMPTISVHGERASSSRIREALAAGDFAHAEALLGRHYQLTGRVMHGKKLGRTLGYPTANVHLPHRIRLAGIGVERVHGGGACTFKDARRFFSYRRETRTGRMASLIWITPTA